MLNIKDSIKKFMFLESEDFRKEIKKDYYNEIKKEEYRMEATFRV